MKDATKGLLLLSSPAKDCSFQFNAYLANQEQQFVSPQAKFTQANNLQLSPYSSFQDLPKDKLLVSDGSALSENSVNPFISGNQSQNIPSCSSQSKSFISKTRDKRSKSLEKNKLKKMTVNKKSAPRKKENEKIKEEELKQRALTMRTRYLDFTNPANIQAKTSLRKSNPSIVVSVTRSKSSTLPEKLHKETYEKGSPIELLKEKITKSKSKDRKIKKVKYKKENFEKSTIDNSKTVSKTSGTENGVINQPLSVSDSFIPICSTSDQNQITDVKGNDTVNGKLAPPKPSSNIILPDNTYSMKKSPNQTVRIIGDTISPFRNNFAITTPSQPEQPEIEIMQTFENMEKENLGNSCSISSCVNRNIETKNGISPGKLHIDQFEPTDVSHEEIVHTTNDLEDIISTDSISSIFHVEDIGNSRDGSKTKFDKHKRKNSHNFDIHTPKKKDTNKILKVKITKKKSPLKTPVKFDDLDDSLVEIKRRINATEISNISEVKVDNDISSMLTEPLEIVLNAENDLPGSQHIDVSHSCGNDSVIKDQCKILNKKTDPSENITQKLNETTGTKGDSCQTKDDKIVSLCLTTVCQSTRNININQENKEIYQETVISQAAQIFDIKGTPMQLVNSSAIVSEENRNSPKLNTTKRKHDEVGSQVNLF